MPVYTLVSHMELLFVFLRSVNTLTAKVQLKAGPYLQVLAKFA
jgi:hypothetical protein